MYVVCNASCGLPIQLCIDCGDATHTHTHSLVLAALCLHRMFKNFSQGDGDSLLLAININAAGIMSDQRNVALSVLALLSFHCQVMNDIPPIIKID